MNPNDDRRDKLLRFLYDRHQTAKGITAIPIGTAADAVMRMGKLLNDLLS